MEDQPIEGQAEETANSFVPEMLVNFVNKNLHKGKEGLEPASFFINGVCLLVDISGFTKLSGDFCSQGKAGIDELQRATNGYMGKLVEIIYTFGGEIIKFAGDAIICVFSSNYITALSAKKKGGKLRRSVYTFEAVDTSGETSPMGGSPMRLVIPKMFKAKSSFSMISPEVVLRAMHCARMLREVQTDKLSVHVAMSCGEMCFGILGGFENRWECLISGPCIHQLSDCLDDAPSKTAVISPECFKILNNSVQRTSHANLASLSEDASFRQDSAGSPQSSSFETETGKYDFSVVELPSGNYRIVDVSCIVNSTQVSAAKTKSIANSAANPQLAYMIRQFVPLPIAEQLESAHALTYLAEIREVTTMFMKWDSYDADGTHRDLLDLQACFYQAQRILQSTGAYLRQFLVDDKGCVLIGCWGMPHMSYLDNAYRALSACAQIKYEMNKLKMNCSFGITTGDVYCGTVGSPLRQEYAAIGSVVNMSARLMCKANGGILIDDATHSRLPTNVLDTLNRLDPIKVKGRDEPLQVYAYTAAGSIHVREKVVEDHEISVVCKSTLLGVVDRMVSHDQKFADPTPTLPGGQPLVQQQDSRGGGLVPTITSYINSRGSSKAGGSISKSTGFGVANGNLLPVVLLQGKDGSGRTTVVQWLKKQAVDRQLLVISVKASKKDAQVDYMVWRKIFQQLMPKDLFLSNDTQRSYVRALLKEVFPDQQKVGQLMGYPALKNYLGITCSYSEGSTLEDEKGRGSHNGGWNGRNNRSKKIKPTGKEKQVPMIDTIHKIFAHLLNLQTSLVIIENIEHADEASLELLVDLTNKLATRSVVVLTALLAEDKGTNRNKNTIFQVRQSVQLDAFHRTSWCKVYRDTILKNKTTTLITLENFTPEEIDKMLAVALGVRVVPPEISQLVQDFSGGSYFWVREILQFIKEHGPDLFMSAVGENEKDGGEKTPSSPSEAVRQKVAAAKPLPKHTSTRQLKDSKSFVNSTSQRSISVSAHVNSNRSQVKLDKLVLCRFESLHSHVQHVLHTASIIGVTFSSLVLYSILKRHLKDQMSDCIKALLNQRWLYQDTDNESLYQFAHPHAHQIIYELTPSSERSLTHELVAKHLEFTCGEERAQFGAICYHYQHCDTDKALQYAVKATAVMLEAQDIFDFGDCLDLLFGSFVCCKSSYDVDVLMKLVNDAKNTIEHLDLHKQKTQSRNWLKTILFSCTGDNAAAIAPEDTIKPSKSFASSSEKSIGDGSGRTDVSDQSDKNYELKAKRLFLEQLDGLNDRLCEAYVVLVDADDAEEAKEWQRSLLGLSTKDTGVLSRFMRGGRNSEKEEVYQVDENLQRKS